MPIINRAPTQGRVEIVKRRAVSAMSSRSFWIVVAAALGTARAIVGRHAMNPDGLSYIDMARAALHKGPGELVNGYWSPGYPALIAGAFWLTRPSAAYEFPVVHVLNLAVFLLTLFLWHSLIRSVRRANSNEGETDRGEVGWPIIPIAYALFLVISLKSIGLSLVTPDLGVLAAVVAVGACVDRLIRKGTWASAAALGAVAGVGYWMKAVLFPLGAALMFLLLVRPFGAPRARSKILVAALSWLIVSAPLVLMVSKKVGHLSFSDVGRLAYAFYVDGEHTFHHSATLTIGGQATLAHPPRALLATPPVLEFDGPVEGTFPLSYAPAYWYSGLKAHFEIGPQLRVLAAGFRDLFHYWFVANPVIPVVLFGLWTGQRQRRDRPGAVCTSMTTLGVWGVLGLVLYSLVNTEPRLVGPFMLLVLLWAFLAAGAERTTPPGLTAAAALAGFVLIMAASDVNHLAGQVVHRQTPTYLQVAGALDSSGIPRGAKLAMADVAGGEFDFKLAYGAHAARDTIVALIRTPQRLPQSTDSTWAQLVSRVSALGVAAIVSYPVDEHAPPQPGWRYASLADGSKLGMVRLAQ